MSKHETPLTRAYWKGLGDGFGDRRPFTPAQPGGTPTTGRLIS